MDTPEHDHHTARFAYGKGTVKDFLLALGALGVDVEHERLVSVEWGNTGSGLVEVTRGSSGLHIREAEA